MSILHFAPQPESSTRSSINEGCSAHQDLQESYTLTSQEYVHRYWDYTLGSAYLWLINDLIAKKPASAVSPT